MSHCIGQSAEKSASVKSCKIHKTHLFGRSAPLFDQMHDNQIEKHHGEGRGYHADHIDAEGYIFRGDKHGKKTSHQGKERGTGRVCHLQRMGDGYILGRIPE